MKVELNRSFAAVSGAIDDLIYRTVNGRVVASVRPDPVDREPSAAQRAQRDRFAEAIYYTQQTLADPCQREAYEKLAKARKRRADKLITADFLTPPEVTRIDLSGYHGQAGDLIRVLAEDDVQVVAVRVTVRSAGGGILEEGAAAEVHGVWRYSITRAAPAGEPVEVTATAVDRPGNEASDAIWYRP